MTSHHLTTVLPARLSHQVTRREIEELLSPASPASPHERQRALVHASLLTREPPRSAAARGGWVPG